MPQRPRYARQFAIFEPPGEILGPAGPDLEVQFSASQVELVSHSGVPLGLVLEIGDARGPQIDLRRGPPQRGDEGLVVKHRGQSGNGGVAADQISFKGREHGKSERPQDHKTTRPQDHRTTLGACSSQSYG